MNESNEPAVWYEASTGNEQGLIIEEGTGRNVAVAYDKADSPLIAAAPAMLAALELAEGWIDAEREGEETGEGQQARWILDTIRAAIAAATGSPTGGTEAPAASPTVEAGADLAGTLRSIATLADNAKDNPRAQTGALFDIRDAALAAIGEDLAGE